MTFGQGNDTLLDIGQQLFEILSIISNFVYAPILNKYYLILYIVISRSYNLTRFEETTMGGGGGGGLTSIIKVYTDVRLEWDILLRPPYTFHFKSIPMGCHFFSKSI